MIQTRNILDADLPAVKTLWATLHAQATKDSLEKNCWPDVPDDRWFEHLRQRCQWAVADEEKTATGFAFWTPDPDGNVHVRAIAATEEKTYLHLCLAILKASHTCAYGYLHRSRPEWKWFENIGATIEPCGFAPMTPAKETQFTTRTEKLAARVPVQDRITVPVLLIPAIQARLEVL